MKKIKVIHIWKDFNTYYGVHDQLLTLARYINRHNFDFSICIFNTKGHALKNEFEKLNVPIHNLEVKWQKNPLIILKLARFLRKRRPHIIQTYCLNTNIFGGISGKLAKIPVIIHTELTKRDQAPTIMRRLRDHLLFPVNAILNHFSDSRVFGSKAVKENWVGRRNSDKYRIINPPFNYEKYIQSNERKEKSSKSCNGFKIGIVARLSVEKCHKDLIDAMLKVKRNIPKVKLLIIGTGPLEEQLRNYVRQLNLEDLVIFIGHKKNVFVELRTLDLFVLPSRSEGLGIAIIEAMAMGLPVVATNVGGIPEVVEDGITGSLVPSENPALLADAIIDLLLNPEKSKQMGERGRERAFKRFHSKEFAEKHEELYKELYTKKLSKIRSRHKKMK